MIRNTRQNWTVGEVVKVGFMKLRVLSVEAVKDGLPDIYTLESVNATPDGQRGQAQFSRRLYQFIPHNGLTRI